MKVHINNTLIRRRVRVSVAYLAISVVFFVGGFVVSIKMPDLTGQYAISLPTLVIGLFFWWRNQVELRRFGPRGRQDGLLARALRGLDNRYHLFAFAASSLPDYLLVGPMGVVVVIPRAVTGTVTCSGGQWRHDTGRPPLLRAFLWFAPAVPLGNPAGEAREGIAAMRRDLASRTSFDNSETSVNATVVFTDPGVKLIDQGCPMSALTLRSLRSHIRRLPPTLGPREIDALAAALGA